MSNAKTVNCSIEKQSTATFADKNCRYFVVVNSIGGKTNSEIMTGNNDICRGCLQQNDSDMNSLTNYTTEINCEYKNNPEQLRLADIYTQCIGIEVDSSSWDLLCIVCEEKLIEFHKFRQMCLKSFEKLCNSVVKEYSDEIHNESIFESFYEDDQQYCKSECDDREQDIQDIDTEIEENIKPPEFLDLSKLVQEPEKKRSQKKAPKKKKQSVTPQESMFQISCNICPKRFVTQHHYEGHLRVHEGKKPWECEHCHKAFEKYRNFQMHLITIHPENDEKPEFICGFDECGKLFTRKESLRLHMLRFHCENKPKPLPSKVCETCGKVFKNNALFIKHNYTHTKITPFKCSLPACGKMFPTNYKLQEHTKRHEGIRNYVCTICGLRKVTGHELRKHMIFHIKTEKYPCKLCSQVFTRDANRIRHMRVVHFGIKKFACTHCDRCFAKAETLKNHISTHTGEKNEVCPICGKRFMQRVALKTHLKTHDRVKKAK